MQRTIQQGGHLCVKTEVCLKQIYINTRLLFTVMILFSLACICCLHKQEFQAMQPLHKTLSCMQAQQSVQISGYFEGCTCIKKHCSCKISSTACMFYLKGWDLLLFLKGPFCPRYNFSDSNSEIMLGTVRRTQILSTARKECCTATIQISHHSLRKAEN